MRCMSLTTPHRSRIRTPPRRKEVIKTPKHTRTRELPTAPVAPGRLEQHLKLGRVAQTQAPRQHVRFARRHRVRDHQVLLTTRTKTNRQRHALNSQIFRVAKVNFNIDIYCILCVRRNKQFSREERRRAFLDSVEAAPSRPKRNSGDRTPPHGIRTALELSTANHCCSAPHSSGPIAGSTDGGGFRELTRWWRGVGHGGDVTQGAGGWIAGLGVRVEGFAPLLSTLLRSRHYSTVRPAFILVIPKEACCVCVFVCDVIPTNYVKNRRCS